MTKLTTNQFAQLIDYYENPDFTQRRIWDRHETTRRLAEEGR